MRVRIHMSDAFPRRDLNVPDQDGAALENVRGCSGKGRRDWKRVKDAGRFGHAASNAAGSVTPCWTSDVRRHVRARRRLARASINYLTLPR